MFWLSNEKQEAKKIEANVSLKDVHHQIIKAAGHSNTTFDLIEEAENSAPILESYWYNNNGKTLDQFKFNQLAFVQNNNKYLFRNGTWQMAELSKADLIETSFEPLNKTNPIEEFVKDKVKKTYLKEQLKDFIQFSDKIKF